MRFDLDEHGDSLRANAGRRSFSRRAVQLFLAAGLAAAAVVPALRPVSADAEGQAAVCSDRTLRGDYGLLASGVRGVPPVLGGGTERFVATAVWTFDGNGTFTQGPGSGLHGEVTGIAQDPGEIGGSYTVNSNCTGTLTLVPSDIPFPIQYTFVIVDNAREIKAAVMSPRPNVVTVDLTRK